MADEVFKPKQRPKISQDDIQVSSHTENPFDKVQQMQDAVRQEMGQEEPNFESHFEPGGIRPDAPFAIGGNMPPEFRKMLEGKGKTPNNIQTRQRPRPVAELSAGSDALENLLQQLAGYSQYEEIELPSKGKFYDNIPGKLHIRPMTGGEEQILATSRLVRQGVAIDMIFEQCIKERINTEELLSVDRTYLLIYLRGISYTPEYEVEIKCPECSSKFSTTLDLNTLDVDGCPVDFEPDQLVGKLPTTGFRFKYRLPTGADEQVITKHRETLIKEYGDKNEDDTLIFRTSILLEYIEGVNDRRELAHLLKKLPINDVAHLRNTISAPPFGVNTEIGIICPSCNAQFEIDLPLEANFFFPRKKEEQTPQ